MTNFDLHKFNLEIFDFGRILINTKLHRSCLAVRAAPSNDYAYLLIQGANKDVVYVVVAVRALVYRLFYS